MFGLQGLRAIIQRKRLSLHYANRSITFSSPCLSKQHPFFVFVCSSQRPGVFNSPFRAEPDEMELRLRKVKPLLVRSAPKERKTPDIVPDLSNLMPNRERLPPIHKKPQVRSLPRFPYRKQFTQKWKILHHFLTFLSFQKCITFFLYWKTKGFSSFQAVHMTCVLY